MTVSTPRRPGPGLDLSEIELDALLKRLHLANLRRVYHDAITRAEASSGPTATSSPRSSPEKSRIASKRVFGDSRAGPVSRI